MANGKREKNDTRPGCYALFWFSILSFFSGFFFLLQKDFSGRDRRGSKWIYKKAMLVSSCTFFANCAWNFFSIAQCHIFQNVFANCLQLTL
ncbi:hypothetical protein BD289DRAFT_242632 [Coniella lustricola]|uniref:Uncharacterized protein n=1 Tax=Coniella lustricola TaxID=2025994 RepID=A0A2T3A9E8_9PEZI|nr:hypothetical protein BD289DRAFT_242632 [Coniella lustricola]